MIEMAVVLVVFSLVMGGLLGPLSSQYENRQRSETVQAMANLAEALEGFALVNGRLPCPDTSGDGLEDLTGNQCSAASGELPWATLQGQRSDAWGNGWRYRVTLVFADRTDGTGCGTATAGISFSLCSEGDIQIRDIEGNLVADKVPAMVVSEGKTRYGTAAEQENRDGDGQFVKDDYSLAQNKEFDDLVLWISPLVLKNRMVAAGRLSAS